MARVFAVGEKVLILDSKKRRYLATLSDGGQFHSHSGVLEHNDIVGSHEGTVLKSTKKKPITHNQILSDAHAPKPLPSVLDERAAPCEDQRRASWSSSSAPKRQRAA